MFLFEVNQETCIPKKQIVEILIMYGKHRRELYYKRFNFVKQKRARGSTGVKMHNLLQVVNRREQCCAASSKTIVNKVVQP